MAIQIHSCFTQVLTVIQPTRVLVEVSCTTWTFTLYAGLWGLPLGLILMLVGLSYLASICLNFMSSSCFVQNPLLLTGLESAAPDVVTPISNGIERNGRQNANRTWLDVRLDLVTVGKNLMCPIQCIFC